MKKSKPRNRSKLRKQLHGKSEAEQPSVFELLAPLRDNCAERDRQRITRACMYAQMLVSRGKKTDKVLAYIAGLALSERAYLYFGGIVDLVRQGGGLEVAKFLHLVAKASKRHAHDANAKPRPKIGDKILGTLQLFKAEQFFERRKAGLEGDGELPDPAISDLQEIYLRMYGEPAPGESSFRSALGQQEPSFRQKKVGRPMGKKDSAECQRQQRLGKNSRRENSQ
jgi:hypothetical protein